LDSLRAQAGAGFEVIIVDNGSTDATRDIIKESYPQAALIANTVNVGAAGARNQGINAARGSWVLTLDSDIVLGEQFLSRFDTYLSGLPFGVGMVQPKILDSKAKIIYSCGIHMSWFFRFFDIGLGSADSEKFGKEQDIFGVCSAASFYRRQMLSDIKESYGYFDERFFFLVEDVDLSWRAHARGWKARYFPDAACFHKGNSSGFSRKARQYLCWRNRKLMIAKNQHVFFRRAISFVLYDAPRAIFLFFANSYVRRALLHIGETTKDKLTR
jgi:GT2 family glycosyltransferase